MISLEQTEVRIVVPPEVAHDTRTCIEDLVDTDIDESHSDELREDREVQDECRQQTCKTCTQKQMECAYEIICRHLGQGGIQVGNACWKLFRLEHGIQFDGRIPSDNTIDGRDDAFPSPKQARGKHVPHAACGVPDVRHSRTASL